MSVFYAVLSGGGTKRRPLSATNAKNRVKHAHGDTGRRLLTMRTQRAQTRRSNDDGDEMRVR